MKVCDAACGRIFVRLVIWYFQVRAVGTSTDRNSFYGMI
jgi:hypothetical protein